MLRNTESVESTGFGNIKLIQDKEGFRYGIDAVLLADFANMFLQGECRIIDLGTGTGIIPLIMSHKNEKALFKGIELQQLYVDMAERSCMLNGLNNRISIIQSDVADIISQEAKELVPGCADMVTSNPPYIRKGSGLINGNAAKLTARHETTADLEDFIETAAWLLRDKGHFCMVHRPSRLTDIIYYCRKYMLEPKDIRFVFPQQGKTPNILLLHCVKGGGAELKFLENLCVYDGNGKYTDEIMKIYER